MDDARLLALLDKHLEQTLSDDERAELEAKLTDSAEARRTFWEVSEQHALMRELAAEDQGLDLARQETGGRAPGSDTSAVRRIQGVRPRRRRRSRESFGAWKIGVALAAAALFIAVLAVALKPNPIPPPPPHVVKEAPPAAPAPKPEPAPVVKREITPLKSDRPEPTPPGKRRTSIPSSPPPAQNPKPEPPAPTPKPEPKKPVAPRRTVTTVATLAEVGDVKGRVFLVKGGDRSRAASGTPLSGGERLETGRNSRVSVRYREESTRIDLIGEGSAAVFTRRPDGGKSIRLEYGVLTADVAPQKRGLPLIVTTPTTSARVLGTQLTMVVHDGSSRLEVRKGRVHLERTRDKSGVDVNGGYYAAAPPTGRLKALPIPKRLAVIGFTLINADTNLPIAAFEPLADGAVIDLRKLPTRNLNIRADTIPAEVGCVRFDLNGAHENTERAAPYALAESSVRMYGIWAAKPGTYELKATPFTGGPAAGKVGGTGTEGSSHTVRFRILDGN